MDDLLLNDECSTELMHICSEALWVELQGFIGQCLKDVSVNPDWPANISLASEIPLSTNKGVLQARRLQFSCVPTDKGEEHGIENLYLKTFYLAVDENGQGIEWVYEKQLDS